MLWVGYRVWARGQPDYYWHKAQAAMDAGDRTSAALYLQNLLRRFPEHSRGHQMLAELYLQENKGRDASATYGTTRMALYELSQAARFRPQDLALQKILLSESLAGRQVKEAAVAAARIVDGEPDKSADGDGIVNREPDNPDAVFALAWQAIAEKNWSEAESRLAQLARLASPHVFQATLLLAQRYRDNRQPQAGQDALSNATRFAAGLSAKQLAELPPVARQCLPRVLVASVEQVSDEATASQRAAEALTVMETLRQSGSRSLGELATDAAQVMLALSAPRGPTGGSNPRTNPAWAQLDERAEKIRSAAIAAGSGDPLVYYQSAMAASGRGQNEAGLEIIRRGLAAAGPAIASRPSAEQKSAGRKPLPGGQLSPASQQALLELHLLAARQLVVAMRFAEAEPYVRYLLDHSQSAGWGHLLAGSADLYQGKLDAALDHYLHAQTLLGNTLLVRMGLANTLLALQQWKPALVYLAALHVSLEQLTPEERAWAAQHLGSDHQVHFAELRACLAVDEWRDAQRHLETLRGTPWEPQAEALAVNWLSARRPAEVRDRLLQARRRFPRDADLLGLELIGLEQAGKTDQALATVEQFAAAAPNDLAAQLLLGQWQLGHHRAAEALQQLQASGPRLAKTLQEQTAVAVLEAHALLALGKPQEALALVEPLHPDPGSATAIGVIAFAAGTQLAHSTGAAQTLASAVAAEPRNGLLGLLRGELAISQGKYAEALDDLLPALEVTAIRQQAGASLLRAVALFGQKNTPATAQAKVDELLRKAPDDSILLMAKADLEFQQGRPETALELLGRAERLEPRDPAPIYLKAVTWVRLNHWEQALADARRALEVSPAHLPSLILAAQASLALKQQRAAIAYATAALRVDPTQSVAVLVRAEALRAVGSHDEACKTLEDLIQRQPELADAYQALAAALKAAGQPDKALQVYRRGLGKLPGNAALLTAEITTLAGADRRAEAEKTANEAAGPHPNPSVCLTLGQAFDAAECFDLAKGWFRRALDLADDAKKPAIRFLLGNSALKQGVAKSDPQALAEARDDFAAVVHAESGNYLAANNLAYLLATEFHQPQEALRVIDSVRGKTPIDRLPPPLVHTLATVYHQLGRLEDAQRVLEEALVAKPDQPKLLLELGLVLADGHRPQEARAPLRRALELGLPPKQTAEARQRLASLEPAPPPRPKSKAPPAEHRTERTPHPF
jgi:tetratricopeptide (TPR) repeat protein